LDLTERIRGPPILDAVLSPDTGGLAPENTLAENESARAAVMSDWLRHHRELEPVVMR